MTLQRLWKRLWYNFRFYFAKTQYGFDFNAHHIHYVGFKVVDGIYTVVSEGVFEDKTIKKVKV